VVVTAAVVALAGCDAPGPVEAEVPRPEGEAAEECEALDQALPELVADEQPREVAEKSPYVAAWGDPAIVLRCGVELPALLDPGSETYDPAADAVMVNQVSWLVEKEPDGYRFTTVERTVRVEVTVPEAYAPEADVLVDLAETVHTHIPLTPFWQEYYDSLK
jgi:hypothetical protein